MIAFEFRRKALYFINFCIFKYYLLEQNMIFKFRELKRNIFFYQYHKNKSSKIYIFFLNKCFTNSLQWFKEILKFEQSKINIFPILQELFAFYSYLLQTSRNYMFFHGLCWKIILTLNKALPHLCIICKIIVKNF